MKKGFTLLEMLVVVGIIAVLSAATLVGYSHVLRAGEHARAHELVSNVATALTALFESEGVWPKKIRDLGSSGGRLDAEIAYCLKDHFSVQVNDQQERTIGHDRFGVVTPWATAVLKRQGAKATLSTHVFGTSTIEDHILRFAVDLDGDGLIENVPVGGEGVSVRASAIVWCCDKEGQIAAYSKGVRKDGIYSWSHGQTRGLK